ncbi:MAG: mechanosensitive ion channel, partial [Proteobacteria bacterium]|nr:mechanosensitive ion channel [Pseudomonadota bacterium]
MNRAWLRYLGLSLLLGFGFQAGHAASPVSPAASATPTIEQVQARLAALANIRDLPESERTQARDLYQQTISQLQAAKNFADRTATYQQLLQSAPAEATRLQQGLTDKPPPAPSPALSADELAKQLAQVQVSLGDAQKRLNDLDQQLTAQQARPKNIPTELSGLKQQVVELDAKLQADSLAAASPLLADARLVALTTQRQALTQQIAMLEQEQLSYDARLALLNAQRASAVQEVAHAQIQAQQLQGLLNTRRRDEAAAVAQQTAQATEEAAAKPVLVQAAAAENATISYRLKEIVQQG